MKLFNNTELGINLDALALRVVRLRGWFATRPSSNGQDWGKKIRRLDERALIFAADNIRDVTERCDFLTKAGLSAKRIALMGPCK